MQVGDIVCAKSITNRIVVEMREDKNGKQRPLVNSFSYKFQPEVNLLSKVGVFLFLGTFPERLDGAETARFAEEQLKQLGWTTDLPPDGAAVDPHVSPAGATDTGKSPTRD